VRARRTIAGFWVTTVVAAAVALCTVASGPAADEGAGKTQASVSVARAHAAQPGVARAHLRFTKLCAALPVGPAPQLAPVRPIELPPIASVVSALSSVPPASRGPPPSSIVDR
jgi:hypothetical protein